MLYGLLLAGGKSSRMGEDKRQLAINGESLLERANNLLAHCGADRILVSGIVEGMESIPDLLPDCGPLGGIHAVLHYLDQQSALDGRSLLLVIPVDMPLLDSGSVYRLVEAVGEQDTCHFEGEIFPCLFRLRPALKDHLDSLFADSRTLGGERSMRALLETFSPERVSAEGLDENVFLNLNRPEDWELFLDLLE